MAHEENRAPQAVILAAGVGARLRPHTEACPKTLLALGGSAIVERLIRNCLSCGISQFVLVLGHREEQIRKFVDKSFRGIRVTYISNDKYRTTGDAYSLMLAASAIGAAEFVVLDGDEVFEVKVLRRLLDHESANAFCVDRTGEVGGDNITVTLDEDMTVLDIGHSDEPDANMGIALGLQKIGAKAAQLLFADLKKTAEDLPRSNDSRWPACRRLLTTGMAFKAIDVTGLNWTDINTPQDYVAAEGLFGLPVATVSRNQQKASDEAANKLLERASQHLRRNCFMT